MELNLKYNEMSILRDILRRRLYEIWLYKSKLIKNKSDEYIEKAYKDFYDRKNEFTEEGRINLILEKIDRIELDIHEALDPELKLSNMSRNKFLDAVIED